MSPTGDERMIGRLIVLIFSHQGYDKATDLDIVRGATDPSYVIEGVAQYTHGQSTSRYNNMVEEL